MRAPDWSTLRDQCLIGLSAIALLWVISQVLGRVIHIVVVVLLAMVLAYALEPALAKASRVLPRAVAALLIYALALGAIAGAVLLLGPPLVQQSEGLALRMPGYIDQVSVYPNQWGLDIASTLRAATQTALRSAVDVATAVAGGLVDTALVLVLAFWFMVDGQRMREVAIRMVPGQQRDKVRFVQATVSAVLGAYIRGQLAMAAIIGLSAGLGAYLLGVHYPVVIGILAFFFELIPMVGPILASLPAVVISLFQPFPLVLYVIAFFVVMQVIENNVLAPRITGGAVGLHPVAALLAIVVGADLGGVVGALFAVPVAGIASVLIAAVWMGWQGKPVEIERAGMRFRLPKRRAVT